MQIIPDHKSENVTKIGARLTKLSPKQYSLSIYGMSVISVSMPSAGLVL